MLISLLKMLICHILGDFVLQPRSWVEKRGNHIRYLFYHLAIHTGLLFLFFLTDLRANWQNIVFLLAAHLAIDSLKIGWEQRFAGHRTSVFLIDQLLHLISIAAVLFFNYPEVWTSLTQQFSAEHILLSVIAISLIVFVIPIIIRIFFSKWESEKEFGIRKTDTLFDAGTVIGIIERAMILGFVLLDFMEGVGFLLAAKSIFRFGDLSNAKDTKFTEYVLIGTLLSFGLGLLVAIALKQALIAL